MRQTAGRLVNVGHLKWLNLLPILLISFHQAVITYNIIPHLNNSILFQCDVTLGIQLL